MVQNVVKNIDDKIDNLHTKIITEDRYKINSPFKFNPSQKSYIEDSLINNKYKKAEDVNYWRTYMNSTAKKQGSAISNYTPAKFIGMHPNNVL